MPPNLAGSLFVFVRRFNAKNQKYTTHLLHIPYSPQPDDMSQISHTVEKLLFAAIMDTIKGGKCSPFEPLAYLLLPSVMRG